MKNRLAMIKISMMPDCIHDGVVEIRVRVVKDDTEYNSTVLLDEDHFESLFDRCWDRLKHQIDEALKES